MPKDLVIIGGAGPHAGALVFEQIITICQQVYGCWEDCDFPYISLINFPFSDCLRTTDFSLVKEELRSLINEELQPSCCQYWMLACNTLHSFLPQDLLDPRFLHMMAITREELAGVRPLVLCTSTSCKQRIHQQFFPVDYPEDSVQGDIDEIIKAILKGQPYEETLAQLEGMISSLSQGTVLLGCTELSFLHHRYPIQSKKVIDPLYLMAKQFCLLYFSIVKK